MGGGGKAYLREKEKERELPGILCALEYCYAPYCAATCYLSTHVIRTIANLPSRNIFAISIVVVVTFSALISSVIILIFSTLKP